MRQCRSVHVIKIYESFQNERSKVYVLEYCNQGNLELYLKKRGAFNERDAISVLKQIICGLAVTFSVYRNFIGTGSSTEISNLLTF